MLSGIGSNSSVGYSGASKTIIQAQKDFSSNIRNIEALSNDDYAQINNEFLKSYEEAMNSDLFKPNSKEEFIIYFKALYQRTVCATELLNPDYPGFDKINMEQMPVDLDSEFEKFLESKGCANEQELQALNKTTYKTTQELRYFSEAKLRGYLSDLDKDKVPYAMSMSKELVSGLDINTLVKFTEADRLESAQMAHGFIKNYSGGNLNKNELLAVEKEFSAYMEIVENQEREAQKRINPEEQLKRVDYSKYDEKYGKKYEKTLAMNYEE